jgi:hypothetical protein
MTKTQKGVLGVLLLIGVVYFALFIPPNSKGARDGDMVSIFEPDEAIQLAHPLRMISGGDSYKDVIRKFFFYQHYYYGFPFYVASVALALLPVKLLQGLDDVPLQMLWLRQMISVLPMILAVLALVYAQTRFKKWVASIALFIFLLTIPAVFENSTWWHPDSLTMLFIALTFLFLDLDELRFGRYFYLAAAACGMATATKLLGLFFFIAIPVYILLGLRAQKISLKTALWRAAAFVAIMVGTFVIANPFLLDRGQRAFALGVQTKQAAAMSAGWNVQYSRGPLAWYPMIKEMYGNIWTILLAFAVVIANIRQGRKRVLNILILAWTVPYLIYVMAVIVIKPHHFLIPIFLPLFSSLATVFDCIPTFRRDVRPRFKRQDARGGKSQLPALLVNLAVILILGAQVVHNLSWDIEHYQATLNKEKNSAEIAFFDELNEKYLSKLPPEQRLNVFRDIRAYVQRQPNWQMLVRSKPATYAILNDNKIGLAVLWNQRALDYTQEDTLEKAINRQEMQQVYDFYRDVRDQEVEGYELLDWSMCCSAYLRQDLYEEYFK